MKKQRGFTIVELVIVLFVIALVVGWVMNVIKLINCDFQAPYKAEIIHSLGIIPFVGMITGWVNVGV